MLCVFDCVFFSVSFLFSFYPVQEGHCAGSSTVTPVLHTIRLRSQFPGRVGCVAAEINKTKTILSKVRESRSIRARSLRSILFLRGFGEFGGVVLLQTNKQTNKQTKVRA